MLTNQRKLYASKTLATRLMIKLLGFKYRFMDEFLGLDNASGLFI